MKRLTLFGLFSVGAVFLSASALSDTHYVLKTGSNSYPHTTRETAAREVQGAVDAAAEGDRVEIGPGDFVGPIEMKPDIVIEGADVELTTVGSLIAADGCEIANLTITDSDTGIECEKVSVLVRDCHVFACGAGGIKCDYSRVSLINCRVSGNVGDAVACQLDSEVVIWGCEITSNTGEGVHLYYGSNAEIVDTEIRGNGSTAVHCYESTARIVHCLICGNGGGGIYVSGQILDSTIADNIGAVHLGAGSYVYNSIIWNNDLILEQPEDTTIYCCDTPLENLVAAGNISADPLFAGWGSFDLGENPIHVQANADGWQDGSQNYPFSSITAALHNYSYELTAGSPCVGSWENMGYYLQGLSTAEFRSDAVRIVVDEGTYFERVLVLPRDIDLMGAGQDKTFIKYPPFPPSGTALPPVKLGARTLLEGFTFRNLDPSLSGGIVSCGPGSTVRRCTFSGYMGRSEWVLGLHGRVTVESCTICNSAGMGIVAFSEASPSARIVNCLIYGNDEAGIWCAWPASSPLIANCTIVDNPWYGIHSHVDDANPTIVNCIIWGNGSDIDYIETSLVSHSNVGDEEFAGENMNISADPRFVNPEAGDFRLRPSSPCIDAGGDVVVGLPATDIRGIPRILFGGKRVTVDMGAHEYAVNTIEWTRGPDRAVLTWSSLPQKSYSIYYSSDLFSWHLADPAVNSQGDTTTTWIDADGSGTGVPPSLVAKRFYKVIENP